MIISGVFYLLFLVLDGSSETQIKINVMSSPVGPLRHFWDSTGFSSALRSQTKHDLLSKSEKLNLVLIATLPRKAVQHVRVHWLLDLIEFRNYEFDFNYLDNFIGLMQKLGLHPSFELMGNPGNIFSDLSNSTQIIMWQDMVQQLTRRYVSQYGLNVVSKWRFETWNEPDLHMYNILNFTLSSYLNYFSATVKGIQIGSGGHLKLGAPAGLFKSKSRHPLCWGLLRYCELNNCPLSFLSFHKKGNMSSTQVLQQSVDLMSELTKIFPTLTGIPFANDEADPLTGWWRNEDWRADVRYAVMVAQIVSGFQSKVVHQLKLPFAFLSNDNGFLSSQPFSFSQRTLLARFWMNNTKTPHSQYFKKPVYSVMALLSMLGNMELGTKVTSQANNISVLSTITHHPQWTTVTVITYGNSTVLDVSVINNVTVLFENIPHHQNSSIMLCIYVLNNIDTNPYQIWIDAQAPQFPDSSLRRRIRMAEGPKRWKLEEIPTAKSLKLVLPLFLPSVATICLCSSRHDTLSAGKIFHLKSLNITFNEVLLWWSDEKVNTKCIKTYEIEFLPCGQDKLNGNNMFRRINEEDTIFLSFHYAPVMQTYQTGGMEKVAGFYRVRAVDFWERKSQYSNIIRYKHDTICN